METIEKLNQWLSDLEEILYKIHTTVTETKKRVIFIENIQKVGADDTHLHHYRVEIQHLVVERAKLVKELLTNEKYHIIP